jgi:hypothetical protein
MRRGYVDNVFWSLVGEGPKVPAFPEIGEMYARRLEEKRLYKQTRDKRHDIAQWGMKIVMNALYGTLAQSRPSVGSFAHYAYAAYITALTRVRIWWAAEKVGPDNIVAIATDSILTTARLEGSNIGADSLGAWKMEFMGKTVIGYQNGLRIAFSPESADKELKKRGFPTLTVEALERAEGTEMTVKRVKPRRLFESLVGKDGARIREIASFVEVEKEIRLLPMYMVADWEKPLRFEILNREPVRRVPFEVDRPEYFRAHPEIAKGDENDE